MVAEKAWRELSMLAHCELDSLAKLATGLPPGDIVIAGCSRGGDAIEIKKACPDRNVIIIDSFEGVSESGQEDISKEPLQKGEFAADLQDVIEAFNNHEIKQPFEIHKMWISDETLQAIERRPVAMIWLDLDLYAPTLACMRYFWPWLVDAGILLTHDYGFQRCPGIEKAVLEFGQRWGLLDGFIFGTTKRLVNEVNLNNLDEAVKYYDEHYWEDGTVSGKSNYNKWEIFEPWDDKFIAHFRKAVQIEGKCILDIGCANGHVINALLKVGINESYGIDLSNYILEKGHRTHPRLKGHTFFASAHEIPFPPEHFDIIFSNQVFEHIPEHIVPHMMREIYRVMKPGAVAWIGLVLGNGRRPEDNPDHITMKPFEWWRDHLEKVGLVMDMSIDDALRATGLDYFKEYGWHSFSFKKLSGGEQC